MRSGDSVVMSRRLQRRYAVRLVAIRGHLKGALLEILDIRPTRQWHLGRKECHDTTPATITGTCGACVLIGQAYSVSAEDDGCRKAYMRGR